MTKPAVLPLDPEVAKQIDKILTPLKQQREALVVQEEELKTKLDGIRGARRSIDKILTAATPQQSNGSKRTARTGDNPKRLPTEKIEEVRTAIRRHFPFGSTFTTTALVEKSGIAKATVYPAVQILRGEEFVRRAGKDGKRGFLLTQVKKVEG